MTTTVKPYVVITRRQYSGMDRWTTVTTTHRNGCPNTRHMQHLTHTDQPRGRIAICCR